VALNLITKQTKKFGIDPFSGIQGTSVINQSSRAPSKRNSGMSAQAQGFFASLVDQGLPCKSCHTSFGFSRLIFSPALFSLFVTPNAVGGAELTIGGIDESKFNGQQFVTLLVCSSKTWAGTLKFAPLADSGSPTWSLTSPRIAVNGKTTSLLKQSRDIIFDSGTSNILFSTSTTEVRYVRDRLKTAY
jgi:hypothetical protein